MDDGFVDRDFDGIWSWHIDRNVFDDVVWNVLLNWVWDFLFDLREEKRRVKERCLKGASDSYFVWDDFLHGNCDFLYDWYSDRL